MTELGKMQVEEGSVCLDEHHDDGQLDNLLLKHQFYKEDKFDCKGFLYS